MKKDIEELLDIAVENAIPVSKKARNDKKRLIDMILAE
jgi:hypothetical protein